MFFIPLIEASSAIQSEVRTLRNQEEVRKYMYTSHEITQEEHERWLASLKTNAHQAVFVAMLDDKPVGVVSLNAIDNTQKSADWAFYLQSDLQGKGLGSIVEFWMLDFAFNVAGLEKLNCEVLEINPSVIKMHQKFGFEIEGVRRKNIIKNGHRIDVVLLGITKGEWSVRRQTIEPLITRLSRQQ